MDFRVVGLLVDALQSPNGITEVASFLPVQLLKFEDVVGLAVCQVAVGRAEREEEVYEPHLRHAHYLHRVRPREQDAEVEEAAGEAVEEVRGQVREEVGFEEPGLHLKNQLIRRILARRIIIVVVAVAVVKDVGEVEAVFGVLGVDVEALLITRQIRKRQVSFLVLRSVFSFLRLILILVFEESWLFFDLHNLTATSLFKPHHFF